MNRNGFTLIELLAVIVLLALITSVTVVSVTSFFGKSKENTEKIFKEELSNMIEDYITMNVYKNYFNCNASGDCGTITLQNLIDAGLTTEKDLIDPVNEETCSPSTVISIKRDDNYVYCFTTSLSCLVNDKNINTCN